MRTTLDIPSALIDEGLRVTKLKTKTALITTALKELIRKRVIADIKNYKGKIDLQMDMDVLRNRQ